MMYFISYDIANPKRLKKVAKAIENYGRRIQYSFFECELEKSRLEVLRNSILEIIDIKQDSLRIYPLCEDCLKESGGIGKGSDFLPRTFQIL